jgi:hypothetical protein
MEIAYATAVFLHIIGALAIALANGIEFFLLRGVQRVPANVAAWSEPYRVLAPLGGGALAVILLTGLFMMFTGAGAQPWMVVSILAVIAIGALGAWSGIRLRRAMVEALGQRAGATITALRDWRFMFSNRARIALLVGIVGLMVFKPDYVGSAVIMAIAAGIGLAWGAMAMSSRLTSNVASGLAR